MNLSNITNVPAKFLTSVALFSMMTAGSAFGQEGDLELLIDRLDGVGAAEVTLNPPNNSALDGFAVRLEQALLLGNGQNQDGEGSEELTEKDWQALALIEEAWSYSEAKMLARVAYGENGPAPQVPRHLSENPEDPDWEFEGFNPSFPEFITEALEARRLGRDRSLDELSDEEFEIYAQNEEAIYRAQREELARARGRAFDGREDLYTAVLKNGQVWRRKMPANYVPSTVEGGESGGGDGSNEGFPELEEGENPFVSKALVGTDTRGLRSRHNGFNMQGSVWRPKGAIINRTSSSNGDPIAVSCTGVKISERLVVTAGHCFFLNGVVNNNHKWVPGADGIAVAMGTSSDPSPNGFKNAFERLVRSQWFDHEWSNFDFGLFILHDNTSSCNLPWHGWKKTNLNNKTIYLYGYPGAFRNCSASPLTSQDCYGSIYGDDGVISTVGTRRVLYSIDTQNGQSGTGFYIFRNNKRYVVGVHRGNHSATENDGVYINSEVRDIIKDAEDDFPPNACS